VRDINGNGVIDNVTEMFGDDGGTNAFAKPAVNNSFYYYRDLMKAA
jgi:hypothetical protein